jgi:hypothetical protein
MEYREVEHLLYLVETKDIHRRYKMVLELHLTSEIELVITLTSLEK